MHTVHFQVPALRPDLARFDTAEQAAMAAHKLITVIHAGRPIRVTIRSKGLTTYKYERK